MSLSVWVWVAASLCVCVCAAKRRSRSKKAKSDEHHDVDGAVHLLLSLKNRRRKATNNKAQGVH